MTEPASDELIEHIKASRTPPTSVEIAALIARIREQDAVMDQMKGTIDDLLAALKGGEA